MNKELEIIANKPLALINEIENANKIVKRLQELLGQITGNEFPDETPEQEPFTSLGALLKDGPARLGDYYEKSHNLMADIHSFLF